MSGGKTYRISSIKRLPRINAGAGCTHNKTRMNAGSQLNAGSNGRAWQCPRGVTRARSPVPSACHQPVSRVPDVGEAQAIIRCSDAAAGCWCGRNNFEGGSCEAVRCRFNGVYMARALAERNKRRPRINAGPV